MRAASASREDSPKAQVKTQTTFQDVKGALQYTPSLLYNLGMRKALGFTLIEILLVITVIGILSVAALSSYMNSTRTFAFVSAYKDIVAILREPRAYAVSSQTVDGVQVQRFGVKISPGDGNDFTVFADDGGTPFELDATDTTSPYSKKDIDTLSGDLGRPYSFEKDGTVTLMDGIKFPIYLFYETGTGNLAVYAKKDSTVVPIPASEMRYLSFIFWQKDTSFLKYITVFQTSGIAEGFDVKPTL
jgi:prepilin-type N-terminal cleavage/methylation domain-containing protein